MSRFQLIVIGIFGFLLVVSVIIFSRYRGSSAERVDVSIWGTVRQTDFQTILNKTSLFNNNSYNVLYAEKNPETMNSEFVEALASGGGPDLLVLPDSDILREKNKLVIIPYNSYSQRSFKDSFVEGAEIYMFPDGILALPIIVDPLVMYWNRGIFNDANITNPPKFWDEFYQMATNISRKDGSLNITKSFVAFGEYRNVTSAKAILSTLMMQAGTPIVQMIDGRLLSVLAGVFDKPIPPADAAINFYTQFSNPVKPFYSWNRSLPQSSVYFLGGDLGLYFGFASELLGIQGKNPNLNFDVAEVPTSREGGVNTVFGKFYGLAISKGSRNPNAAFAVASILSSADGVSAITSVLNLPPVRRDLLSKRPSDAYMAVFYESALNAHSWLDPNYSETDNIFATMIESVTSGRERISAAIGKANREIANLLK